jgi:hypothetical protein
MREAYILAYSVIWASMSSDCVLSMLLQVQGQEEGLQQLCKEVQRWRKEY